MKLISFFLLFLAGTCFAAIELGGQYGYNQQIYGVEESSTVSQNGTASLAIFPFGFLGFELSYSKGRNTITNNNSEVISTVTIVSDKQIVDFEAYGAGIKLILGNRNSVFLPMLGFGYSKQFQQSSTRIIYNDGTEKISTTKDPELEVDSSYASFNLRIQLARSLGLTLGAKTIVPKNKFSDAQNNFSFQAGLSWLIL